MSEFTKGDWWVRERVTNGVNGYEVCWSKDDECVTDHIYTLADANLIAAAPELYEALDDLLDELLNCSGHNVTEAYVIKAEAALRKASGKGE